MDMYISEVHNEVIEEYIDNALKQRHLNMPNIDSYTEFRIKQLAKDMFLVGYKDALETVELKEDNDEIKLLELNEEKIEINKLTDQIVHLNMLIGGY